ncbi:phage baseplate assembly protein V [Enterovibrio makurazakiensis]|uniref:Phage baseplate assembly protein V n=1 Tax=Enterovibrio gelatinilyticus TaxID=2899819 RepID=A0ABT5QZD2_9GAMM|nr:phage baseplate assembly protein V [Enterovibrio sp. ZSDZ42]MDD1793368.1 phage baseplate assembly protein V [Enterovibrio sp. ZSDZ42]
MSDKFYGKYRGTVVNNVDLTQQGRILATVTDVGGIPPGTWCMPCLPVLGLNSGVFAVPPVGAGVWIEFEQGEVDHPIWTGCYAGSAADIPLMAKTAPAPISAITLQTMAKHGIVISDAGGPMALGGITLQTATGVTLSVTDAGIFINNGKGAQISLVGPTVDINTGALTIT